MAEQHLPFARRDAFSYIRRDYCNPEDIDESLRQLAALNYLVEERQYAIGLIVGFGPGIIMHELPLRDHVGQFWFADYSETNRNITTAWRDKSYGRMLDAVWHPYMEATLQLEGKTYEQAVALAPQEVDKLRPKVAGIEYANIFDAELGNPGLPSPDMILCPFVVESVAQSMAQFELALQRIYEQLSVGGDAYFCMLLNAEEWHVEKHNSTEVYPCVSVTEDVIHTSLAKTGFSDIQIIKVDHFKPGEWDGYAVIRASKLAIEI